MKRKAIFVPILGLLLVFCVHANAQKKEPAGIMHNSNWTNHQYTFHATVKDKYVLMEGGDNIVDVFGFALRKKSKQEYIIMKHPADDGETNFMPASLQDKIGCEVKLDVYDCKSCLTFYDKKGQLFEVFVEHDNSLVEAKKEFLYTLLEGRYNHPNGQQYTFAGDKCALGTQKPLKPYTFVEDEGDMPTHTIRTADGQLIRFVQSIQGVDLFKARIDDYEVILEGNIGQLEKVIGDVDNGRWPFTADRIVTTGMLEGFNASLLRVMRNEIYARHGWHFEDPDLREHFSSQWWYKDLDNNDGIKLSETEKLNEAFIKAIENITMD